MITIFVKYSQFRSNSFVFALENARNAVTPPFLQKFSMTVEINQKKLYYNYYTSGKF
jgi:hypothetical protein